MLWTRKKGGTVDNTKIKVFHFVSYRYPSYRHSPPPSPSFFPHQPNPSFEPSSSSTVAFVLIRYRSLSISPTLTRSLSCLVLLFCPVFVCLVACFLLPLSPAVLPRPYPPPPVRPEKLPLIYPPSLGFFSSFLLPPPRAYRHLFLLS